MFLVGMLSIQSEVVKLPYVSAFAYKTVAEKSLKCKLQVFAVGSYIVTAV